MISILDLLNLYYIHLVCFAVERKETWGLDPWTSATLWNPTMKG